MIAHLKALFFHMISATVFFVASPLIYGADLPDFTSLHKQYVNQYASSITNESLSGSSDQYYYTSYYLHGMLSAVESTQDETMLQNVIRYIDNMLSKATVNSAGYKVWGPLSAAGAPGQMNSYKACGPIARAAAVIMQSPTFRTKYASTASRYVDFVDNSIIQYWHVKTYSKAIPWLPADLGGWGTYTVWESSASHLGQIAVSLYSATRNAPTTNTPMYLDIATRVSQAFKRKLQPQGTGWIWDKGLLNASNDPGNLAGVPDTSHINDEARLLVFAYEAGIVFTLADIQKLANTLTDTVWNGSTDNPLFSNYINGSNIAYRTSTDAGSVGNIYAGSALLGKYSSKAQIAISDMMKAIADGKQNASIAYNSSSYGKVALSGHLMRNGGAAPMQTPAKQTPATPTNVVTQTPH